MTIQYYYPDEQTAALFRSNICQYPSPVLYDTDLNLIFSQTYIDPGLSIQEFHEILEKLITDIGPDSMFNFDVEDGESVIMSASKWIAPTENELKGITLLEQKKQEFNNTVKERNLDAAKKLLRENGYDVDD